MQQQRAHANNIPHARQASLFGRALSPVRSVFRINDAVLVRAAQHPERSVLRTAGV